MILIAGLGNPGLKYRSSRHNAGFMAIDALAEEQKLRFLKKRFLGVAAEGYIGDEKVLLLKPHTYMNLSGDAVAQAMEFYRLPPGKLIVVYDDIDLEPGQLRVRGSGSAGSHNGMRSVIARIRTMDFPRVRIGIGKPPPYMDLADYVLQKPGKLERGVFKKSCERGAEAVLEIVKYGVASAQQKYNGQA